MEFKNLRFGTTIMVIDPPGGYGTTCDCGNETCFTLIIGDHQNLLCQSCLAEVAKQIIDALV